MMEDWEDDNRGPGGIIYGQWITRDQCIAPQQAPTSTPSKAPPEEEIDVVVQLLYFDPISEKNTPFPAGLSLSMLDDERNIGSAITDKDGIASTKIQPYHSSLSFQINFQTKQFIDLEKNELISASYVKSGDTRKLIRMPDIWRSKDYKEFSDDRGGRFKNGVINDIKKKQLGAAGAPWQIVVNHKWISMYVSFLYYDVIKKKDEPFPCGLLVEVFDKRNSRDDRLVAAGTILDKAGWVYLGLFRNYDQKDLFFVVKSESGIFLKIDNGTITKLSESNYKNLSASDRNSYYRLPTLWNSSNQNTFFDGKNGKFDTFISDSSVKTKKNKPLTFHLDDFVLVDENLNIIGWNKDNRITIFDHLLTVMDADVDEPYLSNSKKYKSEENLMPAHPHYVIAGQGPEKRTRVVRFENGFYDLTDKRTTIGDIIGVKAAVLNDHPNNVEALGDYDLHYFHDCHVDSKGNPLSHVLVYWCAKFVAADASVTPDDIKNFKKIGTINTKIRHEGQHPSASRTTGHKNYILKPYVPAGQPAPDPNRTIKVCFHIAARDEKPYHSEVRVFEKVRDMPSEFSKDNYKENSTISCQDMADGLTYNKIVMAHEFGHVVGLCDEYLETLEGFDDKTQSIKKAFGSPVLPDFIQPFRALQYYLDYEASLMGKGLAPRMRHFWQYADWVNQNSQAQALLRNQKDKKNQKYQIEYTIGQGKHKNKTLKYYLPDAYRNIYQQVNPDSKYNNGKIGAMDLMLYKIGQDEFQFSIIKDKVLEFDSILVVRINLHYSFVKNADNNDISSWPDKVRIMRNFQNAVSQVMGRRKNWPLFSLESSSGDFQKCCIYFLPHYEINTSISAQTHFEIKVRPATGDPNKDKTDIDICDQDHLNKINSPKKQIDVIDSTDAFSIFRYTLGLAAVNKINASGRGTPITKLDKNELEFLCQWMVKQCGGTYSINQY
jgi:hypothetical protein